MSVLFVTHPYECKCGGSMKFLLYIKTFALSNPQKIKKYILKTKHVIMEIEEEDMQLRALLILLTFSSLRPSSVTLYILGQLQPNIFYFFSACVVLFILSYYDIKIM